ncbi:hypothetical protein P9272_07100 [Mesorhizobium sp. WSM4976]|uniref:hypothetical protein n=1 Tax=Mesorhizobium sp. WSM4976 TaxID=3038549 RepID=UPI002417195D|nr:hypothetical protein [Mesorhizobium sp. WSM4976]MDG4893337.1 hypothetical protein [Mesorhizobium sp. WSM4976]
MLPGGGLDMGKFRRTVPAGLVTGTSRLRAILPAPITTARSASPISAFFTMLAQGSSRGSRRSALE